MKDQPTERRLESLHNQAWKNGVVTGRGVDVAGGPIPTPLATGPGYYGQPVVKPPVWTWEIPVYFFVGGLSGMSAVIALAAAIFHHVEVVRGAMWLAAVGVVLSPILLVLDLGRPSLFINMLRVFKPQSAMSMGAWILTGFGGCVVPGLIAVELHAAHMFGGTFGQLVRIVAGVLILGAALCGMLLATYTGVLIGATAIPAWFLHRVLLPIHFGIAGFGSAAALLELLGHRIAPLNAIGFFAAAVESLLLLWLSLDRHGAADRAIHGHSSGWLIRISEILPGPLALVLRLFGLVPLAAISFLIGSLVSRFGWLAVGKVSGCDPKSVFAAQS
jgi:Polysulphide reductase, NrfD